MNNLSGGKKERLSRHIEMSSSVKEETPKFFKKMRMQGSIQSFQQQSDAIDESRTNVI